VFFSAKRSVSVVLGRRTKPPSAFFFAARGLLLQPPLDRGACGAGRPSGPRRRCNFEDHQTEFIEAILDVSYAVTEAVARQDQFAARRDPAVKFLHKPGANIVGQRGALRQVPAKRCLGVHFVDVLAARAAAALVGELQLVVGDSNSFVHNQHINHYGILATRFKDGSGGISGPLLRRIGALTAQHLQVVLRGVVTGWLSI